MYNHTEKDLKWYEGEDPVALRRRFAQLCAQHGDANPYTIAAEVFKGMPDAVIRSGIAATVWNASVEVAGMVDDFRNRGLEAEQPTLKEWLGGLMADLQACTDPKVRLDIRKTIGEACGFIGKGASPVGGGGGGSVTNIQNNITDNRQQVIHVPIPMFENDRDNEQYLMQKQQALIASA